MNQNNNYYPQQNNYNPNPYPQNNFQQPQQKIDFTQQLVYPMCCCCYSITEKGFYAFLNFFDIVVAVFYLVYNGVTLSDDKVTNSCYLALYSVWFVLAVISYFMYCSSRNNYGTCIHKMYTIIRMGMAIVNLVFVCLGLVLVILALNNDHNNAQSHATYVSAILIFVLVELPLGLVSLNWSCILSRVVHNRSIMNN